MRFLILLLISFSFIFSKTKTLEVTGTLLGADEKPMKLSYVKIFGKAGTDKPFVLAKTDSQGKFKFSVPREQIHTIEFSGVNHFSVEEPLIPSLYDKKLEYKILLKEIFPQKHLDTIFAVIKNGTASDYKLITMSKNSEGIYKAKYKNNFDTLKYQIFNHTEEKVATNGTQADAYEYDGFGDYNSLLINKKGEVELSYNPNNFKINWERPKVEILSKENPTARKLIDTVQSIASEINAAQQNATTQFDFTSVVNANLKILESLYNKEKDELLKKMLGSVYAANSIDYREHSFLEATNKDLYKKIIKSIELTDPLWDMQSMRYVAALLIEKSGENIFTSARIDSLYNLYYGKTIAEFILLQRLGKAKLYGENERITEFYNEYMDNFSESAYAANVRQNFNPNKAIQVGKKAPDFIIKNLEGNNISLADFEGKYLLIDFWATWCGPCMKEMPLLHTVYSEFSDFDFEILSLSFDRSADDIGRLRNNSQYKMPWSHAFVEGGFKSKLAQEYEVSGIPKPILLSPDGTILAFGDQLRGPGLKATIAKYLE